ncbi:MAG TPA: type III secretion inner membrane ring lipoprotein SctJ [Limnobacter sp.]|uniref:type III secretion system inner membrane ring lipoprotein SctJ n=1 Tax=Limnobacter sp. TaxID=2003368 RepID=UPI002ED909F4
MVFALAACSKQVVLHTNLSESDANEIYTALLNQGIPANKVSGKEGFSVTVPLDSSRTALTVLQKEGLPKRHKESLGEVFKKDNLISSPLEERARYLYGLSQEIEKTLMTIDGVVSARVHIVLPDKVQPNEASAHATAAVLIKYRSDSNFPVNVPKVRTLVYRSLPGVEGPEVQTVSVVALPNENLPDSSAAVVWYGPIAVTSDSESWFLGLLWGFGLLWVGSLSGFYVYTFKPEWWATAKDLASKGPSSILDRLKNRETDRG